MSWKDWPYWLRGGVITLGIILGFWLLGLFLVLISPHESFLGYLPLIFIEIISLPFIFISYLPGSQNIYFAIVLMILFYFFLGSLIGWIYGKFKGNKPVNNPQFQQTQI